MYITTIYIIKVWKQRANFTGFQVVAIDDVVGNILSHFVKDWTISSSTAAQITRTVGVEGGGGAGVWALDHPLTFYRLWTESVTMGTA